MHLRSGKSIPSGSRVPSCVSTHSSLSLPKARLEIVNEERKSSLDLDSIETHSILSSLVQPNERRMGKPAAGMDLLGNPTIQLLCKYTNNAGGHVYLNHKNDYVVRISEGQDLMSPPQYAQVTDHGECYMDPKGFKFLKTSQSNDMDSCETFHLGLEH